MKIIHIIPNSNKAVIDYYVKFINENFDANEHSFIIVSGGRPVGSHILDYSNVVELPNIEKEDIIRAIRNNDKVILHYLKLNTYQMFLMLLKSKTFEKLVWVSWGADLYQWKKGYEGHILNRVKISIKNAIAYMFRLKLKYFVGIFPPDIDYFKKEFKSRAITFYASYVGGLYNPLYKKELNLVTLAEKKTDNSRINIQIGHSCSKILNHIQVLENLHKFKNQNIKIYIPLSYGDMEYGDQVEQYAKKLFDDKVICIRDRMSEEDYMDFLSTIDIAIFNTPRQIGLGNIGPMLYMQKKIYMPQRSVMYEHYHSLGINICNYDDIAKSSFAEFIKPVSMETGKEYIIENSINKDKKVEMWAKVFDYQASVKI